MDAKALCLSNAVMPTFKITLAYDGTGYVGWQRQANGVSIQALIEDALRALDGRDVTVTGAGRTDAGVHALGQVAAVHDRARAGARRRRPRAQRASAARRPRAHRRGRAAGVSPAIRRAHENLSISAVERRCDEPVRARVRVARARSARRRGDARRRAAARRAPRLRGVSGDRQLGRDHRARDLRHRGSWNRIADLRTPQSRNLVSAMLSYEVTGTGFLRHMVRIIVGSLVEVGRGRQPVEWIGGVIASRDRTTAGPTAPPQGLFLARGSDTRAYRRRACGRVLKACTLGVYSRRNRNVA